MIGADRLYSLCSVTLVLGYLHREDAQGRDLPKSCLCAGPGFVPKKQGKWSRCCSRCRSRSQRPEEEGSGEDGGL